MVPDVREFRVRALRHALLTSLVVPLAAAALFLGHKAGFPLDHNRWLVAVLLALSAIPTSLHLLSAAAGHPWGQLEREWNGLHGWQRAVSSVVALACGLTTGAAVVLIVLAVAEIDAKATEENPSPAGQTDRRPH